MATEAPSPARFAGFVRPSRLLALACAACLGLYAAPLWRAAIWQDDFAILARSWTARRTAENLWVPNNEHVMPLGRLLAYALVRLAGRPTNLPRAAALIGPAALLAGLLLTYVFVRRELGHPLYGLVAAVLFGVSAVYHQAVQWFSASFAVAALDTLLLALLAAQQYRLGGRRVWLAAAAVLSALAPAWFASGLLAGPVCAVYLGADARRVGWRGRARGLTPLTGTALFLVAVFVLRPDAGNAVLYAEHYGGRSLFDLFHAKVVCADVARAVVDGLLLGALGVWGLAVPVPLVVLTWLVILPVAVRWWRQAPEHRLMVLGMALVFLSYGLIFSARSAWEYDAWVGGLQSGLVGWSRYHLQPQLGLALFVAGGLPGRNGRWFVLEAGVLTRRQGVAVAVLTAVCWLFQLPHGSFGGHPGNPRLAGTLLEVEEMDSRCRQYRVSAEAARAALSRKEIPGGATSVSAWEFLRGSDDPLPLDEPEIRRVLGEGN